MLHGIYMLQVLVYYFTFLFIWLIEEELRVQLVGMSSLLPCAFGECQSLIIRVLDFDATIMSQITYPKEWNDYS